MNHATNQLTDWAINKIKKEFPEDIALLVAVEGHEVNDDGHGICFDYFVPATERGYELSQTFILEGIGHDLYPRSWERTERTADLNEWATFCLGNGKILYSRTPADTERFEALRQRLFDNLKNRDFAYGKALENINQAMELYRTMMFEEKLYKIRMAAGYIADYLANVVAYLNGTYLNDLRISTKAQLAKMQELPDGFISYLNSMLTAESAQELKNLSHLMISSVRRFAGDRRPERKEQLPAPDYANLADWYQELSLTWRRVAYYCDTANVEMAWEEGCNLQNELMIAGEEFGLAEMNLMDYFDPVNLSKFKQRSMELEKYVAEQIESRGVTIKRYATLEEFLKEN